MRTKAILVEWYRRKYPTGGREYQLLTYVMAIADKRTGTTNAHPARIGEDIGWGSSKQVRTILAKLVARGVIRAGRVRNPFNRSDTCEGIELLDPEEWPKPKKKGFAIREPNEEAPCGVSNDVHDVLVQAGCPCEHHAILLGVPVDADDLRVKLAKGVQDMPWGDRLTIMKMCAS